MQRSSEFPLFFQTAIALFGFITAIAVFSSFTTPVVSTNHSARPTIQVGAR